MTYRLQVLAEFRHQLRLFLQFSEAAAERCGLHPQQHQLLLQIVGAPSGQDTTVGYLAERLGLRHNTVVELSKRCAEAGLVIRKQSDEDRRSVLVQETKQGREILDALSADHARELNELAPRLIETLVWLQRTSAAPNNEGQEQP